MKNKILLYGGKSTALIVCEMLKEKKAKPSFIYDEYIVTDCMTLQTDIKKSFLSPSAPLENAPIHASNNEVNEVVGGALHKMKSSHGGASNLSKSQAVAKLSKRLAY